jgi:hypothetical protein
MKKFTTVLWLLLLSATISLSQSLEGVIKDKTTQQPIAAATVQIKNQLSGTISNDEGAFKLTLSTLTDNDIVVISHISYSSIQLPVKLIKEANGQLFLTETNVKLDQVSVQSKEDDTFLDELISNAKKTLKLPFVAQVYYREWVKENASYNRFADGILDVSYGLEEKDPVVRVNQSRAYKLPKDDDEIIEMASPVKLENILNYQYINFLNRFSKKEKRDQYHFYAFAGDEKEGGTTLIIEPKKIILKEGEDKIFYKAIIKADKKKNITEAMLELDSMSNYDKSILGLKFKILNNILTFRFTTQENASYLSFAKADFTVEFTFRKKTQVDNYVSELLLLSVLPNYEDIPKGERYKKSSLYKNGSKFTHSFWEGVNMPVTSKAEQALLEEIKNKQ